MYNKKMIIIMMRKGVYYEQEKRAARLFGFVGFESTEQPVRSGSYGYYMIEVKI